MDILENMGEYILDFLWEPQTVVRRINTSCYKTSDKTRDRLQRLNIFFSWMVFILRDVDNVHCEFRREFNCSLIISR